VVAVSLKEKEGVHIDQRDGAWPDNADSFCRTIHIL